MRHPNQATLALHAGGDLGRWRGWITARHVAGCDRCRNEVAAFQEIRDILPELAEIPEIAWERLAAEMKANIRLGLEAGECVRNVEGSARRRPLFAGTRLALAFASVIALAVITVVLEHPPSAAPDDSIVAQATANGIQIDQRGQGIGLLNRGAGKDSDVMRSVSFQGSATAQYIDRDTGIVTVNGVDGQADGR